MERPRRYAVVGLGHIAQVAVLPAFEHAENSQLVALVSGDPDKLRELGDRYGVEHRVSYDTYDDFLRSGEVDAVFIALPNDLHCEYTVRAAEAGVHVLCEKPMARTEAQCLEMIRACELNGVQLMIGYRLHFEMANLAAIELVRKGTIGEPRLFHSVFTLPVQEGDIRIHPEKGGGPLFDIGIYCINAARYIYRDEPKRVMATSVAGPDPRFKEVEEAVGLVLEFPEQRLATISTSFGAASVDDYRVIGTRGDIHMQPAYGYSRELAFELRIDGVTDRRVFSKRDQFAAELIHFSDCIAEGIAPEPDGYEGLADVRIIEAARRSAREGVPVSLIPVARPTRPTMAQEIGRPPVEEPPSQMGAP